MKASFPNGAPHPTHATSDPPARWIRHQHPVLDGVHLMGDSAGGNFAMMLGLFSKNPELLNDLGPDAPAKVPLRIRSVVSLDGLHDRTTSRRNRVPGIDLMLEAYGGEVALEDDVPRDKAITPMDLDFDACPPSFLAAGSNDRLADGTRALAQRIDGMCSTSRTKLYEGEIHGFFSLPWRPRYEELRRDIFAFLDAHDATTSATAEAEVAEAGE